MAEPIHDKIKRSLQAAEGLYHLRQALTDLGLTIRNQVNKQYSNPTLRWVFMLFQESLYAQNILPDGQVHRYSQINKETQSILTALGPPFLKCYFLL